MSVDDIRIVIDEAEIYSPAENTEGILSAHTEFNDMGNAQQFSNDHRDYLAYCPERGKWFAWDGTHWDDITSTRALRYAEETVRRLYDSARGMTDGSEKDELLKHARRSGSRACLQAMENLARGHLEVPLNCWEKNKYLLNVQNGTIDLRTGSLSSHDANDRITSLVNISMDEAATCPNWHQFLKDVTCDDQDLIAYLQKVVGYALTGSIQEQVIFILFGSGANGKSTFLEIVRKLLGNDYARQTPNATLCARNPDTIRSDLARLVNARFVTSAELEHGHQFSESLIKQMTGGEPITARNLYKDFFEYTPNFKLFIAVNHRPEIKGTDQGIWRRIRSIPFNVTFNESKLDPELPRKLENELPGILNWAVQGAIDWNRNGLGTPLSVREASSEYRAQCDTVERFILECCETSTNFKEPCSRLLDAYDAFCSGNNLRLVSDKKFWKSLSERGYPASRTNKDRFRDGLELKKGDASDTGDSSSHCNSKKPIPKKQREEPSPMSPMSPRNRLNKHKSQSHGRP